MLEVGLRILHRYPMDNHEGYFAQGGISYVLKKNVTKDVVWPTMSFTVHTSDLGFRAPQSGSQHIGERPYYAVLGASDAFGNGLDYDETFVGILADKLKRSNNIDVVNLSIAGQHLMEQSALFKQFASSEKQAPKAVVIIFNPLFIGGYNDNNPNVVVRRGDLYEDENWRFALFKNMLGNTSSIYCFIRDGVRNVQYKYLAHEDFALSFYIKRFSSKHRIHNPEVSQDFLVKLKDLTQYIRSLNAVPIGVYCEPAGGFLLNDLLQKGKLEAGAIDTKFFVDLVQNFCAEEGIQFVNTASVVQERYDKGEKLNFDGDGHYNGPTSQLVGNYLYDVLNPDREAKQK